MSPPIKQNKQLFETGVKENPYQMHSSSCLVDKHLSIILLLKKKNSDIHTTNEKRLKQTYFDKLVSFI